MTLMMSLDRPTRKTEDWGRTRLATFDDMRMVGVAAAAYLRKQLARESALGNPGAADAAAELDAVARVGPAAGADDVLGLLGTPRRPYDDGILACFETPFGTFERDRAAAVKRMVFCVTRLPGGYATEIVARVNDWRALHRLFGLAAIQHCGVRAWAPEVNVSRRRLGPDRVPIDA